MTAFDPPDDWDPTEAIMRGLAAQSAGEPINQAELEMATMVTAVRALMSRGVPEKTAMMAVESAASGGHIHISLDHDGLNVIIGKE